MDYLKDKSSKRCWISIAVVVIIAVSFGIGLSYGLSHRKSDSFPSDISLLINTKDVIKLLIPYRNVSYNKVMEYTYSITAFDYYKNQTIYYSTTKPNEPIRSALNSTYPDLAQYTGSWTKTSIAVDYVTKKLYVVDRIKQQINLVDMKDQYYHVVISHLNNPKYVVLDPNLGIMFILQESSILQANMDGTQSQPIVEISNLTALTIDSRNNKIYYASNGEIRTKNYLTSARESVFSIDGDIISLTVVKDFLFFILNRMSLNQKDLMCCRIEEEKCTDLKVLMTGPHLQDVKNYDINEPIEKNPCEKENGKCQQLCILTYGISNYVCACKEGWRLNQDLKTCSPAT